MHDKPAISTREKVLRATNQIVLEQGLSQLTLEEAAKVAGVSKGGLLYHFPSKRDLIIGLMDYVMDLHQAELDVELRKIASNQPYNKGELIKAYIEFSKNSKIHEVSIALFAAIMTDPELLSKIRSKYKELVDGFASSGLDPAYASVIRLALDGIMFADVLGLEPPRGELRMQIFDHLLRLVDLGLQREA